jgi:hypothetical protein
MFKGGFVMKKSSIGFVVLVISVMTALVLSGCSQLGSQGGKSIQSSDSTPGKINVYLNVGKANQTRGIQIESNQVVLVNLSLTDPSGNVQTAAWQPGYGTNFSFSSSTIGIYTISELDIDSADHTNEVSKTLDVQLGYNYTVTVTIGGNIIVMESVPTNGSDSNSSSSSSLPPDWVEVPNVDNSAYTNWEEYNMYTIYSYFGSMTAKRNTAFDYVSCEVASPSVYAWDPKLNCPEFTNLVPGVTYTVTFNAQTSWSRYVSVSVGKILPPNEGYWNLEANNIMMITNSYTGYSTYSFSFTKQDNGYYNESLVFELGNIYGDDTNAETISFGGINITRP